MVSVTMARTMAYGRNHSHSHSNAMTTATDTSRTISVISMAAAYAREHLYLGRVATNELAAYSSRYYSVGKKGVVMGGHV